MKQKLLFLKMLWRVMRNKEQGWIFFRLTDTQQRQLINNEQTDEITFRHVGVDVHAVNKIIKRLENGSN